MIDTLQQMQNEVINEVNKMRQGLLIEKAPDGKALDKEDETIQLYGFSEVNSRFKPHATLNWFDVSNDDQPVWKAPFLHQAFTFDRINLFIIGPNGTCAQRLASFQLRR